ncbi:hypothetical protein OIU85_009835 [Salix viminalis]|uniref:Uncharacterized protein n=1 Tax=Salix viminalis TaxID=40686 RepID=A0A9Q0NVC2_SALVM|nr:hypothetical protein OIU85_009835 [Salix viminalis]
MMSSILSCQRNGINKCIAFVCCKGRYKKWNNHQNLNFVINFGDIVDGKCPPDQSLDAVKKIPGPNGQAYYDISPGPEYRIVVLDGYDISAIGWPRSSSQNPTSIGVSREEEPKFR